VKVKKKIIPASTYRKNTEEGFVSIAEEPAPDLPQIEFTTNTTLNKGYSTKVKYHG